VQNVHKNYIPFFWQWMQKSTYPQIFSQAIVQM
jgi:hypothetical protein